MFQVDYRRSEDEDKAVTGKVFKSFEELAPMQPEWDDFVEAAGAEIFLTFDWSRVWWKYYGKGRDLSIFIFRRVGNLVGILPLFFETLRLGPVYVRTGKVVGSDFTLSQFSLPVVPLHIRTVMQRFCELVSEYEWDVIHIAPIAGLYRHFADLKTALEEVFRRDCVVLNGRNTVQTYFQLGENWEGQLASLNRNERGNIRKNYNAIRKACSTSSNSLRSCLAEESNFPEFFDDFVAMHQSHWNRLGKAGHFRDWPHAQEFHRELAEIQLKLGRLRLLKVNMGSNCLGYQYHYKFGDKYFHFLDARSESNLLKGVSLGRITFCEQIKRALQEKIRYVDSMQGRYEHKLRLGGKLFSRKSIYIIARKLSTRIRFFVFRALARLLNLCYYRIWFCRTAPKLPVRPPSLRRIWIRTNSFS